MTGSPGTLYLVPNTLDFGSAGSVTPIQDLMPLGVIRVAAALGHWISENAKTTRAFLKRVDAVIPLAEPIQSIRIVELPRPPKGGHGKAVTIDGPRLLAPALEGRDLGLQSEAGLPGVADPGSEIVEAAHAMGIQVQPLPGASSLLLALAASGHNGQSFAFVGYLPTDPTARSVRIKELEALSRRHAQTQLMIETPYRNDALLSALLAHLQPSTRLSISCGLTCPGAFTRSGSVGDWRKRLTRLPADVPAVFSLLGS